MNQIHVYTGDGKGKTTAAFGLALRHLGRGKKVAIVQFMKPRISGEIISLAKIKEFEDKLLIRSYGNNGLIKEIKPEDIKEAQKGLKEVSRIFKQKFDLVILDEINVALALGLLPLKMVIKIIESRPLGTNLVLTGRRAHLKILELADLVTEMRKIKHPFDQGVKAKKGIEF